MQRAVYRARFDRFRVWWFVAVNNSGPYWQATYELRGSSKADNEVDQSKWDRVAFDDGIWNA